jgi:predicted ATPase
MGISEIRLRKFRGFKDAGIEVKPLTVLLGPNSAGKSSFGHALAAMAHAHRAATSDPSLTPRKKDAEEWPVDLGDTNDLRTTGSRGPVEIELTTQGGTIVLGFGGLTQTPELLLTYVSHPSGADSLAAAPADRSAANTVLAPSPVVSSVVPVEGTISATETAVRVRRVNERQWKEADKEDKDVSVMVDGLVVKAVTHVTGTARLLSGVAREELQAFLESVVYLRANRKRPSRYYIDELGKPQALGYSGEYTTSVLYRRQAESVALLEPPILSDPAGAATATAAREWIATEKTLVEAVDFWLQHCALAEGVEAMAPTPPDTPLRLRVTLDGNRERDITEIGFGVSQVVPVLVAGLLQPAEGMLIVDLPEAHLHPRPQAAIADFFCSLALSGRSTLIETHSEMFFHRLRLRAAQNPALLDKIAVYFIDQPMDGLCTMPRAVGLRFEDELKWPEGFLQEAWEMETLISAFREADQRPGE